MSITISNKTPTPSGSPTVRKPSVKKNQVYNLAENAKSGEQAGIRHDNRSIEGVLSVGTGGKQYYSGDPDLKDALDQYMKLVRGDRGFNGGRDIGARFGFLSLLARKLPNPILFDNEELALILGGGSRPLTTAAVDTSGRMWVNAEFLKKCIAEDQADRWMTVPLIKHELFHVALDHTRRLREFEPGISNIAKDIVINKMIFKSLADMAKKLSPMFTEEAWGNKPEHARFDGLSEETIAKILQSEHAQKMEEKGTVHIKKMIINDGTVDPKNIKTLSAGKDETKEFDVVVVTVQDMGAVDITDTVFDCSILKVDEVENNLKPRSRNGCESTPGPKGPIEIPIISDGSSNGDPSDGNDSNKNKSKGSSLTKPGSLPGEDDDNPFNGQDHEIDLDDLNERLRAKGWSELADDIKAEEFDERSVERAVENALDEASEERMRVGQGYPGGHVEDYIKQVVKPSKKYNIAWMKRAREFLQGQGMNITRSMDGDNVLNVIDAEDIGMTEDERAYLPGTIFEKPDDRVAIIVDTSGSVWCDDDRLSRFVSFAVSVRSSADDSGPSIDIFGADTCVHGNPSPVDDESLQKALAEGVALGGGGGTDFTAPIQSVMAYARKNDLKYSAVMYVTDLECSAPAEEDLPEDLPALMFLALPSDYKRAEHFIKQVEGYAEVVMIDKNMNLSFNHAEAVSQRRGLKAA
jgi:predicted metal-dependent peptidase